jgi:hypothetical protein
MIRLKKKIRRKRMKIIMIKIIKMEEEIVYLIENQKYYFMLFELTIKNL